MGKIWLTSCRCRRFGQIRRRRRRRRLDDDVVAYPLNLVKHKVHLLVGRRREAVDHHPEEVAQVLVLQGLVADHEAALLDHPLLDEGCNLVTELFSIIDPGN